VKYVLGCVPKVAAVEVYVAISGSWWCDYEVVRTGGVGGIYTGVARSLQAAGGGVPGLAGHRPTVRVQGDVLRFMANSAERPRATWTLLLAFWWHARKARSATVRAFEMTAHGIHAALAPSCVLRVQHQRYGGPGVPLVVATKGTLLGTGESWRADDFAAEPW
jgi:hypothetical protein